MATAGVSWIRPDAVPAGHMARSPTAAATQWPRPGKQQPDLAPCERPACGVAHPIARRSPRSGGRWRSSPAFWVLAGTFSVCGASTNGLIGTHLIAACHDYGIAPVRSAQLLAVMGIFDIVGTTGSGWLTNRYSSRHLLFGYYTLRGLSRCICRSPSSTVSTAWDGLPCSTASTGLPPCRRRCGSPAKRSGARTRGDLRLDRASHQLGASLAAFGAGAIRTGLGAYQLAFWIAGGLCASRDSRL